MSKIDRVLLSQSLSKSPTFVPFSVWIIGDTPLICHAWSEKARREMLVKQVGATKPGKEKRDPNQDFMDSLYDMGDKTYGFPVTGFKNSILSAAHKDKGIPRSTVMAALYIEAEMVRTRPALAGAVCDMPLVRIHGTKPEMREDMVRIGTGMSKVANLAYRAQFTIWAVKLTGRFNKTTLSAENLAFLISEAGISYGVGEWRNEKKGMFGAFHLADEKEEALWEKYLSGKGKLPTPASYKPVSDLASYKEAA